MGNTIVVGLGITGAGLILNELMLPGVVLLFAAAGIRLADFRWAVTAGRRHLVAKGSPALLIVAVMLAVAQGYVAAVDSVLMAFSTDPACPLDVNQGRLLVVRILELLR